MLNRGEETAWSGAGVPAGVSQGDGWKEKTSLARAERMRNVVEQEVHSGS